MVDKAEVKIYAVDSKRTIHLPLKLVEDSAFPFKVGDKLLARIDGRRLVIEKMEKSSK